MAGMAESTEQKAAGRWARFLLVAVAGLALDLWSKWWAFKHLAAEVVVDASGKATAVPLRVIELIPGWVHFHVTVNQGAAMGRGQGLRWFFVAISIVAIGFLFHLFRQSRHGQWLYQVLLGMLLGGVIGNLYDRVLLGYVRDMIYVLPKWGLFPWIFNVADSLLCIGVAGMVLLSLTGKLHPEPESRPAKT